MSVAENGVSKTKYRKTVKTNSTPLVVNPALCSESPLNTLSSAWSNRKSSKDEASGIQFCNEPFRHCMIPNLIQDQDRLVQLQEDLSDLEFKGKNNDLYKFHQSADDLKISKASSIAAFINLVHTEIKAWLIKLTGIPLNDKIDAFCARYSHTDTLLCHDDELEGRRIAYIYYLVNNWTHEDGGALDLYTVDENIQPDSVVKSILPERNNFAFFEVSPGSYHQVAEVVSEDRTRLSISGWFHGPPITRPKPYLEKPRALHAYGDIDDEVFFDWINPLYLSPACQGDIQERFETDSEIELEGFIQKEKYDAVLEALQSCAMCWKQKGPANKRCYKQGEDDSKLPEVVQTCIQLFKSDAMFLMLSNLTGLKLHELAPSSSEFDSESDCGDSGSKDKGGASTSSHQCESSDEGPEETSANSASKDTSDDTPQVTTQDTPQVTTQDTSEVTTQDTSEVTTQGSECRARCHSEVRRWSHRSYSLMHDANTEAGQCALDLLLYLGCSDWELEYGGFTSYIAKGEDEELLTVTPKENSLALVYRDEETLKFVKYLNCQVDRMPNKGFYDISVVYSEK